MSARYGKLEERVRFYSRALLIEEKRRELENRKQPQGDSAPKQEKMTAALGDNPDAVAKAYRETDEYKERVGRKAKKKKEVASFSVTNPDLIASLHNKPTSKQELASLQADAEAAILEASELAGEQVYWCCGSLRPAREVGKGGCVCRDVWRYQVINGW